MSYYVIGIGGTGAKCVEALAHLCAAGLAPDGDLYAIFVDPDTSNGNLERANNTLQQYINCKQIELGHTQLFKTRITLASPDIWSPLRDQTNPTLSDFFAYNGLRKKNEAAAHLFDVLYSPEEKETNLDRGFRGHPSIGAAVMVETIDLGADEPWRTFRDKLAQDVKAGQTARVILFGSIFGGTGASGIPTIGRLIRDELKKTGQENARLGAILMLPFFSFDRASDKGGALKADSENFLLSTQAALKYYHNQAYLNIYDSVYLLGEHVLSHLGPSVASGKDCKGGKDQKNEPHFIELYAALASLDFFEREEPGGYPMVARDEPEQLGWSDLPYRQNGNILRRGIDQLARFAFAYLNSYYPMLTDIDLHGKSYRAPWFVDYFERGPNVSLSSTIHDELVHVKEYCETFLRWLANTQTSARDLRVNLVNYLAFAEKKNRDGKELVELRNPDQFILEDFAKLTLSSTEDEPKTLSNLWERMSDSRYRGETDARGIGSFIQALYRECKSA